MKITIRKSLSIIISIVVLGIVCFGLITLNPRHISILISVIYIVFFVMTKTTNLFRENLFIIQFEKSFFLLITIIVAIVQLTFKEVDRSILLGLGFLMLFVLCYLIFSWVYEKIKTIKELKNEKLQSELLLLKSQINPHFFFNTLNNLYGLSIEKSDETPKVLLKLSEMMRYTIYDGKKESVTLKSEIQNLRNYIDLHKIRHFDKLNVNFKISITNQEIKIAPLLLINLLENAFKHGVEILNENAYINIDIKSENNRIEFTIENNYDAEIIPSTSGIGLQNLKRRLSLIYPNSHSIKISDGNHIFKVKLIIELP